MGGIGKGVQMAVEAGVIKKADVPVETKMKTPPANKMVNVTESSAPSKARRKRTRGGTIIESTGMTA